MKTLLFCFGTRPEAIKLAPLILAAKKYNFSARTILTGQHREMVAPFVEFFQLQINHHLNTLVPHQSLAQLSAKIIEQIDPLLGQEQPTALVVQGDTTSALIGAIASFYHKVPVVHIEAGLRSQDATNPFPEEMNRRLISQIAQFHFAPTTKNFENLKTEGITKNVFITGNTGIDALKISLEKVNVHAFLKKFSNINFNKKIILMTVHRRENFDHLKNIFSAVKTLCEKHADAEFVFPVHLNPQVQKSAETLKGLPQVHLLPPLNYQDFILMMKHCYCILTDSGGLQEEAPYLNKPVLVLRQNTERPEGLAAGTSRLVGVEPQNIVEQVSQLFTSQNEYDSFAKNQNPYGDGHSSEKILSTLKDLL